MKNIFLKFFILSIAFTITSCEDELELFPQDAIAVDLGYKNVADYEAAAKGLYSGFRRAGYYGADSGSPSIYFIPDVMSDDVIINGAGRRSRESFYDWRYDEDNSTQAFWLSAYKVIQRANLMLENIDNLTDEDARKAYRGEALAARGIAHFDLAKLYASSPNQAEDSALGIPYVTSTDASLQPARNSLGETYDLIINDLETAATLMGNSVARGRLSQNAIYAILSRVYLFMGNCDKTLEYANLVTGQMLNSVETFPSLWKDATEEGVLWKIVITEPDDVTIGVSWLQESPTGVRSEYNVDYELYTQYQDNDIRKSTYFETSDFDGTPYNHIVKYRGRETGNANEVDAKVIRYAEVVLNRAECYAEMNMDEEALEQLDELRANRYQNFVSGNEGGQDLKDAIALERRLELAFEGMRFFDLKRKGLPIVRSDFGDVADGSGITAEFMVLPADDYRFNMAIGEGEMNANENMVQNPGY